MISPTNTDLVHRDPAIIGLKTILDPDTFLRVLRPYLGGMRIENLQMTYIRYKPGTRCLVNYRLDTGETSLNVYAIAHGYDQAIKIRNVRKLKMVNKYGIHGRIILEDQGIVISVFPNDRRLKALVFLDDNEKQMELLSKILPDRPDLWDGTFRMLNYKPERRFVAMLQTKSGPQAVVRFYKPSDYQKSIMIAEAFHSVAHLHIPRKIGCSNHYSVLVFEWLDGQVLSNILNGNYETAVRAIYDTGVALAEFHLQQVDRLMPWSIETEKAENLLALADTIKFLLPHLSTRVLELAHHLANSFSFESIRRPIHGDFYAKQVLVNDNKQVAFIDLDEAKIGDPRIDLGLFIAHLRYMVLSGRLAESRLPLLTEAFLSGYQQTMGKELLNDLHPYVAVGLFRILPHPFRHGEKEWVMWTEQILNMAESEISKARSNKTASSSNQLFPAMSTKVPVVNPYDIGQDQKMSSFLLRALNPQEIEPFLADMLSNQFSKNIEARLRKVNVLRYKPNRRCLVEYEIEVKGGNNPHNVITLIGKARSKGPDFTTYNLVRDLWNSGFDSNSADFISVPQPIGIIPELHMWFQKKVTGIPAIDPLVRSNHDSLNLAARIAEAIDKVHRTDNPKNLEHTIFDELKILDERLTKVAEEKALWKTRIECLLSGCQDLTKYVPEPKTTSVHRDFYHDQVIVDGHRIYITDFDNYCKGDPALDIGNFKAHIEEYALRKNDDVSSLSDLEEVFVQRFLELSGKSKRFSVEAYTTFTLARHIWISTQFPSRRHLTDALISLCERRLHSQLNQV
jgi:aminoglycoside phosphotransferase (APT) family kinase protein